MKSHTLFFTAPSQVEILEQDLPALQSGEVLVESLCSAISPGTEMLVYRGLLPKDVPVDECFPGMEQGFSYPLAYGYAIVGRIVEIGKAVNKDWLDRLVFAFHPHATHFVTGVSSVQKIPDPIGPEGACILPNMETAVNLVQDAAPLLGERALVFGQGILGLLIAALLREFPLASLSTVDRYPLRRKTSLSLGVTAALDPEKSDFRKQVRKSLPAGADLTIEVSGAPEALNEAIALTGFGGRVIVGSWYGEKRVTLDLGGAFHRSRIKLVASQVSTISPELSARWNKSRRFEVAWQALGRIQPEKWITHHFPFEQAGQAYRLLDETPHQAIQVLLQYRHEH